MGRRAIILFNLPEKLFARCEIHHYNNDFPTALTNDKAGQEMKGFQKRMASLFA